MGHGASAAALVLILGAAGSVHAQDASEPRWRVDLSAPQGGLTLSFDELDARAIGAHTSVVTRAIHPSGHGIWLGATITLSSGWAAPPWYPLLEIDYVYRAVLLGTADMGLVLDSSVGLSFVPMNCVPLLVCTHVGLGGNAGGSITLVDRDVRVSFDARYRVLVPTNVGEHDAPLVSHGITLALGLAARLY